MLLSLPIPPTHTLKDSRRAKSPDVRLFQTELETVGTWEGCVIRAPEADLSSNALFPLHLACFLIWLL